MALPGSHKIITSSGANDARYSMVWVAATSSAVAGDANSVYLAAQSCIRDGMVKAAVAD